MDIRIIIRTLGVIIFPNDKCLLKIQIYNWISFNLLVCVYRDVQHNYKITFSYLKFFQRKEGILYTNIPLAIIAGICDVLVVGLVTRLFIILVGKRE